MKARAVLFIVIILIPLSMLPAQESEIQESEIPLFVYINGFESGQIQVKLSLNNPEDVQVDAQALIAKIENIVIRETAEELKAGAGNRKWTGLGLFTNAGIGAQFNAQDLRIELTIPLEKRRIQDVAVRSRGSVNQEDVLRPSPFSAFLNLRGQAGMLMQQPAFQFPYTLNADMAFNLYGWVLEGGLAHGYEGTPGSFYVKPNLIRIIKDFEEPRLRLFIGDLSYPVRGYQSFQKLQGVSISKVFDISPEPLYDDTGQTDLVITSPSQVEVWINGQQTKTLDLQPGRYSVKDFSIRTGINRILLKITDAFGNTEEKEYSVPFDTKLIPRGNMLFSYSLGIPQYTLAVPQITGFHSFGIADWLTAGFNFQLTLQQQMFGLEAVFATVAGTFGIDVAGSNIIGNGFGGAARLQYRYENPNFPNLPVFFFGVNYLSRLFAPLGNLDPDNKYMLRILGSVSARLPFRINAALSGNADIGYDPDNNKFGFTLTGSKSIGDTIAVRLGLKFEFPAGEPVSWEGSISLTARLPEFRSFASMQQEIDTGRTSINWNTRPENRKSGASIAGGIQGWPVTPDWNQNVYASVDYSGYRFQAGATDSFSVIPGDPPEAKNQINIYAASALVLAGGRLGISSPVNDSFVVITPEGKAKEGVLGVNPVGDTYSATTRGPGPAVLPGLKSYRYENVYVESPDLPIEYDLGKAVYKVFPSYKSGTLIKVGTASAVYTEGTLVTEDGRPIALQAGEAAYVPADGSGPQPFFTDREGKFYLYNIKPGRYELYLYSAPDEKRSFQIPEDSDGLIVLDPVTIPVQVR